MAMAPGSAGLPSPLPMALSRRTWTHGAAAGQGGDFLDERAQTGWPSLPGTSHYCCWRERCVRPEFRFASAATLEKWIFLI